MAEEDLNWTPKQDMSLLCRVCANQHDYLIPIFEGEGLDHDMPTKMDKHLPIKVRENDKLPTQMCYQCASTIIAWSDLVTNCLEADKKLTRMLKINEKKAGAVTDDDAGSDHFEDAYDNSGGGDDDEDFEKEIKQLISDAGVEIGGSSKATKAKSPRASTRKRKSEVTPVKKSESKKAKSDSSSKSSTALIKPKEEVQSGDDSHFSGNYRTTEHFVCDLCNATFLKKLQLVRHISWYHPETCDALDPSERRGKLFTCYICTYSNVDKKQLYHQHLREAHNENASSRPKGKLLQLYTCNVCGKLFKSKYLLKTHSWTHSTNEKQFRCDVPDCNAKFKLVKYLDKHRHSAHWNLNGGQSEIHLEQATAICTHCAETSTASNGECPANCSSCGKTFLPIKEEFAESSAHCHPNISVETSNSDTCSKLVKTSNSDTCSRKSVKTNGDTWFEQTETMCDLCSKIFPSNDLLRKHKANVHRVKSGKKYDRDYFRRLQPKMCPQCGKSVKNLANHLKLHSGEKFQCSHCAKAFGRVDYLKIHLRIHTGERPYVCYLCGLGFKQHGDMNKHIRAVHKLDPVIRKD